MAMTGLLDLQQLDRRFGHLPDAPDAITCDGLFEP